MLQDARPPVRRTLNAASINAAANHPDVRPWLGELAAGPLDLTALVADPANVTMANDHGGFLLHRLADGLYEAHSIFKPEGRGRLAAETRRSLHFLFCSTDAVKLLTRVPACNPRAAALARIAGFEEYATQPDKWDSPDGGLCDVSYQAITLDRWIATAPELEEAGRRLAETLHLSDLDDTATRTLGAVAEMIRHGAQHKAAYLYAVRSQSMRLPPVQVVPGLPPLIVAGDVIVQARADQLEMI